MFYACVFFVPSAMIGSTADTVTKQAVQIVRHAARGRIAIHHTRQQNGAAQCRSAVLLFLQILCYTK